MLTHPNADELFVNQNKVLLFSGHACSSETVLINIQFPEALQGKVLQLLSGLQCAAEFLLPNWRPHRSRSKGQRWRCIDLEFAQRRYETTCASRAHDLQTRDLEEAKALGARYRQHGNICQQD